MKVKNKSAFSIVMAMLLVLVMSLLVIYILEYMIPYSKNVKGIENSSNSFYQAENGIEDAFLEIKNRTNITHEFSTGFTSEPIDYKYNTYSSGSFIPYKDSVTGIQEGNSNFSGSLNQIAPGNPIQLEIGYGYLNNFENSIFRFKVPDLNLDGNNNETLSGGKLPIINWQLSSENDILNASGSWILANDIPTNAGKIFSDSTNLKNDNGISFKKGLNLSGTGKTITDFYSNNCGGTSSGCILKFSIINKLETTSGIKLPYLEYKLYFGLKNIPLRFSRIKSAGKSYGFQKYLEVRVPQETTNEAFDFTVFQ